ncbi:MAG: hypothetical protein Q4E22_05640 [Coriobacteriia bacterium]|nr:hypothetical protein [Coriobacteriia bacterium]
MAEDEVQRYKRYVEVIVRFTAEGHMFPKEVIWEDGRHFVIDRIIEARRAASLKVGGTGMRYLCQIGAHRTYLYFEDPAWFVEQKIVKI